VLLVHRNLLVDGERVVVVEQALGDEAARHDQGAVAGGGFRVATLDHVIRALVVPWHRAAVASALDVPDRTVLVTTRYWTRYTQYTV
jgi:hypothetical protein